MYRQCGYEAVKLIPGFQKRNFNFYLFIHLRKFGTVGRSIEAGIHICVRVLTLSHVSSSK